MMQNDQDSVKDMFSKLPKTDKHWYVESEPGVKFWAAHQTEEQQQMMLKYGKDVIGMDATHKTHRHGYPWFLLTIVTNHGHVHPVEMFLVESESTDQIVDVLNK